MFIWDYNAIFAFFWIISMVLVFVLWVAYTLSRGKKEPDFAQVEFFRQCHYCGHVYLDYQMRNPCRCVRCLSYHEN